MEVHHHSHTPRKKWTHYFWEFFMLFLAVTAGFFVENQREHMIEHKREKIYIRSMREDAMTDTANLNFVLDRNRDRVIGLDSLVGLCYSFDGSAKSVRELYRLNDRYFNHPDLATLTERTLSQLKNAGGMRLIRNKKAADSIIYYEQWQKKLTAQESWYFEYFDKPGPLSLDIFNFRYYRKDPISRKITTIDSFPSVDLLKSDRQTITLYGNYMEQLKLIILYYIDLLEQTHFRALRLIQTLKKEYHLK